MFLKYLKLAAGGAPPAVDGLALRALDVQHTFRDTDCAFSVLIFMSLLFFSVEKYVVIFAMNYFFCLSFLSHFFNSCFFSISFFQFLFFVFSSEKFALFVIFLYCKIFQLRFLYYGRSNYCNSFWCFKIIK